ncbi:MAG: YigZ family protein [Rhodococcus sp. (in: high G+C Gram-positive bacteria)]
MPSTLSSPVSVEVETVIERSRFRARAAHVDTEADALALVAQASAEYGDAGHHCWAFVVGADQEHRRQRCSDDGEPGGTAGVPMLGVLTGRNLVDVAVVVSRWFGGVKLGAGGLVRAYSGAVSAVLDSAAVGELTRRDVLELDLSHADAGRIDSLFRAQGFVVDDVSYGTQVHMRVVGNSDDVRSVLASATGGSVQAGLVGHRWVLDQR